MQSDRYHYTECGLDNIYLLNGFESVETPRGKAVQIKNIDGLHRAIGTMLAQEKKNLNGNEFRFLRHEINQTQQTLAGILGVNVQSVARWEKGRTKSTIDGPAQRLLRILYMEFIKQNNDIAESLRELSELDEILENDDEDIVFTDTGEGWQPQPMEDAA